MATPPLIAIDELLAPIPGDNPAGSSIHFEITPELEELRREVDPNDWPADDPMRPKEAKKAEWAKIVDRTKHLLQTKSKDLKLAARLAEALTQLHGPKGLGFAGLRDGLCLLRRLVEECWDRVLPAVENDGEIDLRAAPFEGLSNADRGITFPVTIRLLPLLRGKNTSYNWQDWKNSSKVGSGIRVGDIEKALREEKPTECQDRADDVAAALKELKVLTHLLNEKMGTAAPALHALQEAIEDCKLQAEYFSGQLCPVQPPKSVNPNGEVGQDTSRPRDNAAPSSRAEAYGQLKMAASVLRALEPHSPVPYLVERAIELGDLPFPQMIRQLIRDANVLAELSRELGLNGTASSATSTSSTPEPEPES